jgi:hypothetical protein
LPERLLESLRERVIASLFVLERLREYRFAPCCFGRKDALGIVQLRPVTAHGLDMANDPPQVAVDDERRFAARTRHFEF